MTKFNETIEYTVSKTTTGRYAIQLIVHGEEMNFVVIRVINKTWEVKQPNGHNLERYENLYEYTTKKDAIQDLLDRVDFIYNY